MILNFFFFLLLDNRMHSRSFDSVLVIAVLKYADNFDMINFIKFILHESPLFLNMCHIREMFPLVTYHIIVSEAYLYAF